MKLDFKTQRKQAVVQYTVDHEYVGQLALNTDKHSIAKLTDTVNALAAAIAQGANNKDAFLKVKETIVEKHLE